MRLTWCLPVQTFCSGCCLSSRFSRREPQVRFVESELTSVLKKSTTLLARVKIRKLLAEMSNLGRIVVHDIHIVGMSCGVVLMVGLSRIKSLQWDYLGHDAPWKDLRLFKLSDVSPGNPLLFVVAIENR